MSAATAISWKSMNKAKRWQLAIQFVAITFLIFTGLFAGGLLIFSNELNNSLDEQLDTLLTEISDEVEEADGRLSIAKPRRFTKKQPLSSLARIELYDAEGKLIEHDGVKGTTKLITSTSEVSQDGLNLRTSYMVLTSEEDKKLGYLQIQLPTTLRDRAIKKYIVTMGIISTLGLVLLSIAGLFFSKSWVGPLETSYRILRQFTEDATHELKTPIATIEACADNLEEELKLAGKETLRLDAIKRATGRMNKLVEDLTLLTQIQIGFEGILPGNTPGRVSFNSILCGVLEEFELRLKEKRIDLVHQIDENIFLNGYEDKLHRMIANIIENALRYTDEGGRIELYCRVRNGWLKLMVRDNGSGIPAESLPRIFDRFYRVDKARARAQGGVGLGLSIVKGIVDLHNGTITITSEENQGTGVTINLPILS
ncbi:MAG TPA: HAMP domain-containing sensor histidine kinase [Candidatus Melainabacteria bacterium]|nr:HAMP domain-containing sensor histidine kinase [Candidatus Melainabacteria bacterium]